MKLNALTVSKAIAFLVLTPMASLFTLSFIAEIYWWITGGTAENVWTIFIMFGFTAFVDFLLYTVIAPKFYSSMDAVKGYMSYLELKKCIAKEVFEKPIQFWDKKYKKKELYFYISKDWICVNGHLCNNKRNPICISRKILSDYYIHPGVKAPRSNPLDVYCDTIVLTIHTTTGYEISTGYIKPEEIEEIETIFNKKIPEFSKKVKFTICERKIRCEFAKYFLLQMVRRTTLEPPKGDKGWQGREIGQLSMTAKM